MILTKKQKDEIKNKIGMPIGRWNPEFYRRINEAMSLTEQAVIEEILKEIEEIRTENKMWKGKMRKGQKDVDLIVLDFIENKIKQKQESEKQ